MHAECIKQLKYVVHTQGKKGNILGISSHGMFKSIKYLGHIHYSYQISGLTDKMNKFQSKGGVWCSIELNFQCNSHFFLYLPNLQAGEKIYKTVALFK